MMKRRFAFCSHCETRRPVVDRRCALCGTPVRLHPAGICRTTRFVPGLGPQKVGWLGVAAATDTAVRRAA